MQSKDSQGSLRNRLNRMARARARRRGVSPIIATILLVAITVVLAAVLYVLISGLTHSGASTPYVLEMGAPASSTPATGFYEVMSLSPTTGLSTTMFGLALKTGTGGSTGTIGTAPAACKWTAGGTAFVGNCLVPATGTWYAALFWQGNGSTASVFTTAGWSTTFPVTSGMELAIVTTTSLVGSSDFVNAYSTGSSSVSGQSNGF